MDGAIHLAIPVDGSYRRWGEVAARSARKGSSVPVKVHFIDWSVCDRARLESLGRWHGSAIAWSRLYLSEILPTDIDWVISCDADVLFRGDIAKLWALRDERYVVMMSRDSLPPWLEENSAIGGFCRANGLDAGEILCSGLSLINLRRWRKEGWQSKVDAFVARHGTADFLDQTALNVVFRDEKCALPRAWGCFSGDLNEEVDYSGDCAIHYVSDPPWKRGKLTQLMSDAVVLWRQEAGMPCGGWRRWLYLLLRATSPVWRRNRWMAWHFRGVPSRKFVPFRVVETECEEKGGLGRRVNGMMAVDSLLRKKGMIVPDEIWVHGMWTPDKWLKCMRAKLSGKMLVRMTHGSLSPIYLERQSKWKKRLVKPIERLCFALANRIVVTGPWELEWARAWGLKRRLVVLDLKQFFKFDLDGVAAHLKSIPVRAMIAPLKVLYLGRIHPLKGTDALERAVAELNSEKEAPDDNRRIEMREVCNHSGAELEEDWRWADVLCLPTLSENFGLVVAEALERGVPVITTDGAPAWEGQEGVIYLKGYQRADLNCRTRLLKDAFLQILGLVPNLEKGSANEEG